jgi:hypothetical protein
LCTELGPAQSHSHRPGVGFRPHSACPYHSRHLHHCFLTAVHRPWVLTVPQFSAPMCAALTLSYIICELNAEGFPFVFSSSCSLSHTPVHRAPPCRQTALTFPRGRLHRNDLHPSSPPLHDLRAGTLHHSSGLPPVIPPSPPRTRVAVVKPLW